MNVRIFWVRAMKCMCAQTRPRFILSSEGVFGGMEFEPMLTPREKSPLPENVPRGGSNPWHCGQRAQALPTELFRPPIKIIWSKLETKEQSNKMLIYCTWSVPDHLVTPGTESLTHTLIFWMQSLTHIYDSRILPVSTFSFSHLQNFHLFFTDASISDTSAFSPFASTTWKDEIYDQVVGSLSGQVFQSGCHQYASSQNIVDTHTKWPPIRLQSLNGWLASDDWVTSSL